MNKILLISLLVCALSASLVSSLDKSKHCKCRIKTESRIVGGKQASRTDYPWMVSLTMTAPVKSEIVKKMMPQSAKINVHNCGGVILNEWWILTAAHCMHPHSEYYVGFGNDNDLVKIYDAGRTPVEGYIPHRHFTDVRYDNVVINDIALVKLLKPINFTQHVLPACLDTAPYVDHKQMTVTGYGLTSRPIRDMETGEMHVGEISRYLKELEYEDITSRTATCRKYSRGIICADSVTDDESGCKGDSGGPLHKTRNGKTTVVGLVSSSDHMEYEDNYQFHCNGRAMYTRVGHYLNWIEAIIGEEHC